MRLTLGEFRSLVNEALQENHGGSMPKTDGPELEEALVDAEFDSPDLSTFLAIVSLGDDKTDNIKVQFASLPDVAEERANTLADQLGGMLVSVREMS